MSEFQIESYLSGALDQEACKDTLIDALISRVITLRQQGISTPQLVRCLNHMCEDDLQINDDIIVHVMELLLVGLLPDAL